jgi:heat shock protein HtpX
VTGTATTVDALKMVHSAGMAFDPYWHTEIVPAIQKGYRPAIADGFREFSAAPSIATNVARALSHELTEGKADPYDTHPPLRERVAALESAPAVQRETIDDTEMAISLLENVQSLEVALLDSMVREDYRGKLKPLAWDDAGTELWIPVWREQIRAIRQRLDGFTPAMLPTLAADPGGLALALGLIRDRGAMDDDTIREAAHIVGAALAIALHDRGFTVRARPGHQVMLVREDLVIEPFGALGDLMAKTITPEAWRDQCERAAIASVDLGTVASDRPA